MHLSARGKVYASLSSEGRVMQLSASHRAVGMSSRQRSLHRNLPHHPTLCYVTRSNQRHDETLVVLPCEITKCASEQNNINSNIQNVGHSAKGSDGMVVAYSSPIRNRQLRFRLPRHKRSVVPEESLAG